MKNMFKILFCTLLFQASLLFAQETDVLYQFKTSPGKQWETFGNVKIQPIYKGEIKNGIPNGQATNTFSNGWNGVGEWIDVEPWNIKVFNKKGDLKMKWTKGKVQYF